ncbi:MAG: hypothetical protein IJN70_06375 [Clostridia bacterium]|nr:hypothetical protein [Clostridia bacterium]
MKKLKNRFLYEFREMRNELLLAEYISWWFLRIAMLTTAVVFEIKGEAVYQRNLILLNTLASFAIPILRFISPEKLFTSKISFRTQSYIDIFILAGSFFGHGLKFLGEVPEYDKLMHVAAGGIVVFIGAEIIKTFKGQELLTPGIKTFSGVGFSFVIIVAWELMEFFADWFITDSQNQGYNIVPDETMFFVKIFGMPKNMPAQAPVYDTNVDMFYAVIGCAVCAVILFIFLRAKERKNKSAQEQEALKV